MRTGSSGGASWVAGSSSAALGLRRHGVTEQPFDEDAVLPLAVGLAVAVLDADLVKACGAVCGAAGEIVGEDAAGEFVQAPAF